MDGIYFDNSVVGRVKAFASVLKLTKCTLSGQPEPLELLPHSLALIVNLLGWKKADGTRLYRKAYWSVARKNAKALALNTPIPTPTGWTTMGDIREGDIVFSDDGSQCRVVATSEVFTDHDCYEIEFSNGERIIADAGHKWLTTARVNAIGVQTGRPIAPHGESFKKRVRTTEEIYRTQVYGVRGDRNHSLDMPEPIRMPDADLPIDPYFLGVWLGDGDSSAAYIHCGNQDKDEIASNIEAVGYSVTAKPAKTCWRLFVRDIENQRSLSLQLRDLGVAGNKRIPAEYLRASFTQRLALLQGLMDTDGTVNKNGRVLSYVTTVEALAGDIAELLASLGIKYSVIQNKMVCNGLDVPGTAHNLQFVVFRDDLPVFRLERKLNRMRFRSECSSAPRCRTVQIVSVRKVESVPTKCISVDSASHLFLCGRTMLPTHNTQTLAFLALYLLFMDPEPGQEIYVAAKEREQAGLCYEAAAAMLATNEDLSNLCQVTPSQKLIQYSATRSKIKALSSEGKSKHGFNPSLVIFDELHVWGSAEQELYDALTTGSAARREPLFVFITTAGTDEQSLCYREYDYANRVKSGQVEDPTYLPLIWEVPKDADWTDENNWALANPSLDVIVRRDELRSSMAKALAVPSEQNSWRRLHLNQWVNAATQWIPLAEWDQCCEEFSV